MLDSSELELIYKLSGEGLTVTAIARRVRRDRKTIRKYLQGRVRGVSYVRRVPKPSKLAEFVDYLQRRVSEYPDLTASRLLQELRARGYSGSVTILKERVRELRHQAATRPRDISISQ